MPHSTRNSSTIRPITECQRSSLSLFPACHGRYRDNLCLFKRASRSLIYFLRINIVTLFSLLSSNPHYAAYYYSFCHMILYLYLTNGLSESNLILRLTNSLYISILVCAPFHNLYKPIVYTVFCTLNLSYIHSLVESLTSRSQTFFKRLS